MILDGIVRAENKVIQIKFFLVVVTLRNWPTDSVEGASHSIRLVRIKEHSSIGNNDFLRMPRSFVWENQKSFPTSAGHHREKDKESSFLEREERRRVKKKSFVFAGEII